MAMPFGFLGHMARMFPSYIEGERQAVSDNWRDLNMHNNVLAGQMRNSELFQTRQDRINQSNLLGNNAFRQNQLNARAFPAQDYYAAPISWAQQQELFRMPGLRADAYNRYGYAGVYGTPTMQRAAAQQQRLVGSPPASPPASATSTTGSTTRASVPADQQARQLADASAGAMYYPPMESDPFALDGTYDDYYNDPYAYPYP